MGKYGPLWNHGKQWENTDLGGTKQNIHRSKGFDESYSKLYNVIEFEPLCQKLWLFMSNLPSHSPMMVMSRDPALKFRKFLFFAQFYIKF